MQRQVFFSRPMTAIENTERSGPARDIRQRRKQLVTKKYLHGVDLELDEAASF